MKLPRRDVLIGGAATLGLAACGQAQKPPDGPRVIVPGDYDHATEAQLDPATVAQSDTVFPLGIQAGAMQQDGALLWTQTTSTAAKLRVWRETATAGTIALAKDLDLTPSNGFVRTRVDGLAPATVYRYAFFDSAGAARTSIGRFRTAYPEDWKEPLTVGATACTNFRFQPYRALELMGGLELDAFVHLGDIAYLDAASTETELRALWKKTLTDPGYRKLLSSTGWYPTWDDHELENDFNPETPKDPARLALSKQIFFETLTVEKGDGGTPWGRTYVWGGTAEFFVLDCRSERKPSTIGTPEATYISRAQMDWLKTALSASKAHFKVLLNSVPITNMPPPLWGNQNDRWQGYTAQREELLNHIIDADIRNVVFLSGDFHLGLVMRVEKTGPRRRLWEVACGPGGNGNNPLSLVWDSPENRETGFPKAQFEYCAGQPAATTLRFDPKTSTVLVRFLDPETGDVRFEKSLSELT